MKRDLYEFKTPELRGPLDQTALTPFGLMFYSGPVPKSSVDHPTITDHPLFYNDLRKKTLVPQGLMDLYPTLGFADMSSIQLLVDMGFDMDFKQVDLGSLRRAQFPIPLPEPRLGPLQDLSERDERLAPPGE